MSAASFDCDVLVAGLGPVGAVLTALLAQRGVHTIAIDRDLEPYPLPRAVHFDHETGRILQSCGIGAALLGKLADVRGIEFVYSVCSFLPLIGLLTAFLPDLRSQRSHRRPSAA